MNRNRTTLLGGVLVAALAVAAALSTPRPAHALLCCETGYQTAQYWASGATCSDAQAAYRALARPEADATCGGSTYVCAFTIPPCEDWASVDPANPYKIDGVANFGCKYDCAAVDCSHYHQEVCRTKGAELECVWNDRTPPAKGYCKCGDNLLWACI